MYRLLNWPFRVVLTASLVLMLERGGGQAQSNVHGTERETTGSSAKNSGWNKLLVWSRHARNVNHFVFGAQPRTCALRFDG
ncbi:uncharacterized protein CYBJADRAFT_3564 [Cyberlindnera jadinii NRRL Y-1542]|uniref:Secreted protein n=1 Tax=Cyberlindnera jadinii (strain ATCC 18201 / CBS 1600 / BCRC 20928 / JCM 3617 / NBRC 0987 / NRRL Y-1542) TaxID=983966 RepID=A0A1E4S8L6_CYBJN|nr:hypothetical protein CYBJADRAFT_3564 [Cyberlindnera jadinii NRRL Y-1542]ODV75839.1 hypothetical protein CYBJADRAFT_3564 [Cyberlindnera jadinii NRRL Y-1542]